MYFVTCNILRACVSDVNCYITVMPLGEIFAMMLLLKIRIKNKIVILSLIIKTLLSYKTFLSCMQHVTIWDHDIDKCGYLSAIGANNTQSPTYVYQFPNYLHLFWVWYCWLYSYQFRDMTQFSYYWCPCLDHEFAGRDNQNGVKIVKK